MSWEPPKDEIDSASMRGEIYMPIAFIEIIVEDANGKLKAFDAKQCAQIGRYAKSCPLPVRITETLYKKGSGMTFKYRTNKRRPNMVPGKPETKVWFFEGVPKDWGERVECMKKLARQEMKLSIIAALFGCSVSNIYKHARKLGAKSDCISATVAAHTCA